MMRWTVFLPVFLLVFLTGCSNIKLNKSDMQARSEIKAIEQYRIVAMMKNSVEEMEYVLADDMVHITTDGTRRNKSEYLKQMSTKTSHFSQFQILEQEIRIYGDIAVTTGLYQNQKADGEQLFALKTARFTRVYRHEDTGWKLVSHQATKIQ